MIRRWRSRRFWKRVTVGKTARVPKHLDPTRTPTQGPNPYHNIVTIATVKEFYTSGGAGLWLKLRGK